MVTKVTKYQTEDGLTFDTEWKAKRHEMAVGIAKILKSSVDDCETVMEPIEFQTMVNVGYLLLHSGFETQTLNDIVQFLAKNKVVKNAPTKLEITI